MLGAAGALCCLAAGTAIGGWLREQRGMRLAMLQAQEDMLGGMRVLLVQERMSMVEVLERCAKMASEAPGAAQAAQRFVQAAEFLQKQPMAGTGGAYRAACCCVPAPFEHPEAKAAMSMLFLQLGTGTAAMREQAVAACVRRLKPLVENARADAQRGGKLCVQLGMLLGLMAGVALW